jgi:hypothetical protein
MSNVIFPEIRHMDFKPTRYERFNSVDAKKFLHYLFSTIVSSDIYTSYLDIVIKQIEDDRFDTTESIRDRIVKLKGAELPFIITADSDFDTGMPADLHLQRFNPRNGRSFIDGFASFADFESTEIEDDRLRIVSGYNSFSKEQCDALLDLTNIQMRAGLDPRNTYDDLAFGFVNA